MGDTTNSPVLINNDNNIETINNTIQVASNVSEIASRAISFTRKTWIDNAESGTPITAADMNRLEQAIVDLNTNIQSLQDSVSQKLFQNLFVNPNPSYLHDYLILTVVGRIAYLSVSIHTTIAAGAFRRVATLPNGLRPQVSTYASMANFPNKLVRAFVSADTGDISFYADQTQDGVTGSMSFPLA